MHVLIIGILVAGMNAGAILLLQAETFQGFFASSVVSPIEFWLIFLGGITLLGFLFPKG